MFKPSILFAIAISASAIGCHTVEPGNVGVFKRFGTIDPTPRQPGLYATGIVLAGIEDMSTRTQSYTMAGPGQEAQSNGSVNVLSQDQLAVALDVTIQFHLNGQYAERHTTLAKSIFPEDVYEFKYIHITEENSEREGIGLILRQTSYPFIPSGFVVLAMIAEYDKQNHVFKPAINPS